MRQVAEVLPFLKNLSSKESVKILHKCDNYYITLHYPRNPVSRTIIVAFDIISGCYSEKGFGVDFCLANNYPVIFVSHKGRTFFQGISKSFLYDVLHPYLIDKDVVTYGSSLGGYAAIYYADILNARAFSISPRCSIDPKFKIKFNDNKLNCVFLHDPMHAKRLDGSKYHFFLYDSLSQRDDFYFKRVILPSLDSKFKVLELPFSSHPSAPFLNKTVRLLKPLVLSFFKGEDIASLNFVSFQEEKNSKNFLYLNLSLDNLLNKAKDRFDNKEWKSVASLLYVPMIFYKLKSDEAAFMLAVSLAKVSHQGKLIKLYKISKEFNYSNPKKAVALAGDMMTRKQYTDAILFWECVVNIYSQFPLGVYVRLASAYISINKFQEADKALQKCIEKDKSFKPAVDLLDRVASLQAKKLSINVNKISEADRHFRFGTKVDGNIVRQKDINDLKIMGWAEVRNDDAASVAVKYKGKVSYFPFNIERPDVIRVLVSKFDCKKQDLSSKCGVQVSAELGDGAKVGLCLNGDITWTHDVSLMPVPELVEGKDNWLFLANDQNRSIDQFTGKLLLDDQKKLAWESYASDFFQFSKQFNTLYVIANSKERVLPDLYPYPQGQEILSHQVERILSNSLVNIVNPLAENYKNTKAYYRTDTHWSDLGAFNAFKLCMKTLGYSENYNEYFNFLEREVIGDLGSKLNPPVSSFKMVHAFNGGKKSVRCVFDNKIQKTGSLKVYLNEDAAYQKSVVMFGGSSLTAGGFSRYFTYFFSRVVVINLPGSIVKEIVDYENPDHVIVQTNERYLTNSGKFYQAAVDSSLLKIFNVMSFDELSEYIKYFDSLNDEGEFYYKKLFSDAARSFSAR